MKTKTKKILAAASIVMVGITQLAAAASAETLIFSNEVLEENANKMILDFDNTGGDVTLQFGEAFTRQLFWNNASGAFTFTDDVYVAGELETAGAFRVDVDGSNGYIELVGDANSSGDWDLVINNDEISADLTVTAGDLKKLVDITSTAAQIDNSVSLAHTQNTDTGTDNPTFTVDNSAGTGSFVIEDTGGAYKVTINNTSTTLTADLTVTADDLKKLVDITSTAAQIDQAVAKMHDQNTDTSTSADSFNVNNDGDDATLKFGQNTDGEITYDDSEDTFDMDGNRVVNIVDPEGAQDAATKNYVDGLVQGLTWKDPVEHESQLINGASGGVRAGGKIYVADETVVAENDTITFSYNGGALGFTLTAKDAPTASSCEFKSGVAATDNSDMASSILTALQNCPAASDFSSYSLTNGPEVYPIHNNTSGVGNGTIATSGSGFIDIDMHDGKTYASILNTETRISRNNETTYTWDGDTDQWVAISSASSIPDATTSTKGKVELATDGETAPNVVVQGNDSRLHNQNTDTGTNNNAFTVDSSTGTGSISIEDGEVTGNYDLVINNNGMSTDVTVTGADLEKLVNIASTATQIDNAVASGHDQNTDTGTDNTSFRVNSGATGGYIDIVGNQSGSNYTITVNNAGLSTSITVTGADLEKLINISSTAAQIDAAVTNSHAQNTDTGTTSESFLIDSDDTTGDLSLQFGAALNEKLIWDEDGIAVTDGAFKFTDDLIIEGSLTLNSGVAVNEIIDDDTMGAANDSSVATSESIKAYVDNTTSSATSGKADKVSPATAGNLAGLDATGNLTDSGVATSNVALLDGTQTFTGTNIFGDTVLNGHISGSSVNTNTDLSGATDTQVASTLAIKTYVDGAVDGVTFADLDPRTKVLPVTMNNMTVVEDGSNNSCNIYSGSEVTATNPHEYYLLKSYQPTLQDLDVRVKVKLPEDFVDFSNTNDLVFNYRNTGSSNADSRVDIIAHDGDATHTAWNNSASTPAVGVGMFSSSWATYSVEFDTTGTFNPSAGDYVYITIKGYAKKSGSNFYTPYIGELYLTYQGR